jgi:hypothetical protein
MGLGRTELTVTLTVAVSVEHTARDSLRLKKEMSIQHW